MKQGMLKKEPLNIAIIIIALIAAIIPLIVYMKKLVLTGASFDFWTGVTEHVDFFSFYKSRWLLCLTAAAFVVALFYIKKYLNNLKCQKLLIPLGLYFLFVFLSTSFSEYKNEAIWGFTDRYEGFFVIASYVALCFMCIFLINSVRELQVILRFLICSMVVICIIGISQFWSFDLIQSEFGKKLILPTMYEDLASVLKFTFPDHYIYSTLYNPNYVGSYFAMLLPICLSFFILSSSLKSKIIYGILVLLAFINAIGCLSSAGIVGVLVASLVLLVLSFKKALKNWPWLIGILVCFFITVFFMNLSPQNIILDAYGLSNSSTNQNAQIKNDVSPNDNKSHHLTDISSKGNELVLQFTSDQVYLSFDPNTSTFSFSDANRNVLTIETKPTDKEGVSQITFLDKQYKDLSAFIESQFMTIITPNLSFTVVITKDEGFKYYTPSRRIMDFVSAKSIGFEGYETIGSSRGYIWSRSIPVLKDTIFIGKGPDNFAIYFPQNDISAKIRYMGNINIVDKPHNMYIQMAINTGVLSLLSFLTLVLWYLGTSVRLYFNNEFKTSYAIYGIAFTAATVGYMITAIFNDSLVSVSPVFWIMLGSGIATNALYRKGLHKVV